MEELAQDRAIFSRVVRTLILLSHTTTDFGVWAGGAMYGAGLVLSYIRGGQELPEVFDMERKEPLSEAAAVIESAIIGTLHREYERWKRRTETEQVLRPGRFELFERTLTALLRDMEEVQKDKGGPHD